MLLYHSDTVLLGPYLQSPVKMTAQVPSQAADVANVPGFLTKLWLLVENKDTDNLIKWSEVSSRTSIAEGNSLLYLT